MATVRQDAIANTRNLWALSPEDLTTSENAGIAWALELEATGAQELQLTMTALRQSPMFRYLVEFYERDPLATDALRRYIRTDIDRTTASLESRPIRLFAARMFLAGRLVERNATKAVQA